MAKSEIPILDFREAVAEKKSPKIFERTSSGEVFSDFRLGFSDLRLRRFGVEAAADEARKFVRRVGLGEEFDAPMESVLQAGRTGAVPGGINDFDLWVGAREFGNQVCAHHSAWHDHVGEDEVNFTFFAAPEFNGGGS